MTRQNYIIDTRHRAGLNISTLNRRRPARGNGNLAHALVAVLALIIAAVAIYTTANA